MKTRSFILLLSFLTISVYSQEWVLGPFVKTKENPIVRADSTISFICPVTKESVKWQKADVFNPAAIVKGDKVYLFTRCEDNKNAGLGRRTSRIGIAMSKDLFHWQKKGPAFAKAYNGRNGSYIIVPQTRLSYWLLRTNAQTLF